MYMLFYKITRLNTSQQVVEIIQNANGEDIVFLSTLQEVFCFSKNTGIDDKLRSVAIITESDTECSNKFGVWASNIFSSTFKMKKNDEEYIHKGTYKTVPKGDIVYKVNYIKLNDNGSYTRPLFKGTKDMLFQFLCSREPKMTGGSYKLTSNNGYASGFSNWSDLKDKIK